jgi:hypothetical protein
METGLYGLVEKILYGVTFIAVGGTLALIFFFVFAPSILGSKTVHRHLENLENQARLMNERLNRIVRQLEDQKQGPKK